MEPVTLIGYILAVAAGLVAVRGTVPKQTIFNQKQLIDTYEKRLQALESSDTEKDKAIAVLTSKVEVLQTIPLGSIADAIKEIVHTQKEIIKLIKES